jgi:hypothetical protein
MIDEEKHALWRDGHLTCGACGYSGADGWNVGQVDQTEQGENIHGWFCPECHAYICTEHSDCPPDGFGQL